MSTTKVAQNSANAGEWSPLLYGERDRERYYSALETCRNFVCMTPGGIFRRWGTRYVGACETAPPVTLALSAKDVGSRTLTAGSAYWTADDVTRTVSAGAGRATITAYTSSTEVTATVTVAFASAGPIAAGSWTCTPARKARLLPFVAAEDDAVVVECNGGFQRFYQYGTSDVPELVTSGGSAVRVADLTTRESHLRTIQHMQSIDVLALVNAAWHPKALSRLASDNTAWGSAALAFDVPATFEAKENVSQAATLSNATVGTGRTITIGSNWFLQGDVGRIITWRQGRAIITAYTSATVMVIEITSAFESVTLPDDAWHIFGTPQTGLGIALAVAQRTVAVGETVTVRAYDYGTTTNSFRAGDVGKYLVTPDGPLLITAYTNGTTITAIALAPITATIHSGGYGHIALLGTWSLEVQAWSAAYGYPRACCLHQQRVIYGPSTEMPSTFWGGPVGEFYSLAKGTNDDQGFQYTVGNGQMDGIRVLTPGKSLTIGTVGEIHTAVGGEGGAIVPSSPPQLDPTESGVGAAGVQPVRSQGVTIFVGRGQRAIYAASYDIMREAKKAVNLLIEAGHLTAGGQIVEVAVQRLQAPLGSVPIVWALLDDTAGTLLGMTWDPEQKVMGWHAHTTDGIIESICAVPHPSNGYDDLWLVVNRTIGGVETRMVEILTAGRYLDSSVTGTNSPASATITGLSHLEGKAVIPRATRASDSVVCLFPAETVSGGQITVDAAVTAYEVGLPYTATAKTLPLGIPGQHVMANAKAFGPMRVLCYDTPELMIQGSRYRGGGLESAYSAAAVTPIPTTDAIAPASTAQGGALQNLGVDELGQVTLVQDLPLPTTILAIEAEVTLAR